MEIIFEIIDENKKRIHLSKERYKHILKHPNMHNQLENIKITIENPTTIRYYEEDKNVVYYYKEFKNREPLERYLLVSGLW